MGFRPAQGSSQALGDLASFPKGYEVIMEHSCRLTLWGSGPREPGCRAQISPLMEMQRARRGGEVPRGPSQAVRSSQVAAVDQRRLNTLAASSPVGPRESAMPENRLLILLGKTE